MVTFLGLILGLMVPVTESRQPQTPHHRQRNGDGVLVVFVLFLFALSFDGPRCHRRRRVRAAHRAPPPASICMVQWQGTVICVQHKQG